MILLDTNICIYILNARSQRAVETLRAHATVSATRNIAISSITLAELTYGVAASAAVEKNRRGLERFLTPLDILPFDDAAARQYGDLRATLKRAGTPIGSNATFIAAHALALGATLVTNNEREFRRVPELKVENWFDDDDAH